jgi:Outer membrane protein beta-barrel domain
MRRLIFGGVFVMAVASISTPAWAQVGGGIKAGVNLASISGFNDEGDSTSQRTGLVVGGFLTAGLAPMLALQPEVLFSMQGSKLHFSDSGIATDATAKLDYLQVPVLLRIGNSGKDAASVYGIAGPTFGFLMSADQDGEDVKDQLKNTDIGMAVGVGVSLSRLLAEGRYTYGLTDLNKVAEPSGANRNRVISIFIGLAF